MSTEIPDLWSDDISVDVLAPLVILRVQAENLSRKTHGVLVAQVSSPLSMGETMSFDLEVIAPAVNRRIRILTARHVQSEPYPVIVSSPPLTLSKDSSGRRHRIYDKITLNFDEINTSSVADTQQEMLSLTAAVLQSGWLKSRLQSLVALSNEATAKPA